MFEPRERHSSLQETSNSPITFPERHLTVELVARRLNLSEHTVRRMFRDEPGVVKISRKTSHHSRPKTANRVPRKWEMLLIPLSVFERVYRRLTGGAR